jgi:hypothetical protein
VRHFAKICPTFRSRFLETGKYFRCARAAKDCSPRETAIVSDGSQDRRRYTPSAIRQEFEMAKRRKISEYPGRRFSL